MVCERQAAERREGARFWVLGVTDPRSPAPAQVEWEEEDLARCGEQDARTLGTEKRQVILVRTDHMITFAS